MVIAGQSENTRNEGSKTQLMSNELQLPSSRHCERNIKSETNVIVEVE